jgi:hypothetical protein
MNATTVIWAWSVSLDAKVPEVDEPDEQLVPLGTVAERHLCPQSLISNRSIRLSVPSITR